jgi:hypothetical protein
MAAEPEGSKPVGKHNPEPVPSASQLICLNTILSYLLSDCPNKFL